MYVHVDDDDDDDVAGGMKRIFWEADDTADPWRKDTCDWGGHVHTSTPGIMRGTLLRSGCRPLIPCGYESVVRGRSLRKLCMYLRATFGTHGPGSNDRLWEVPDERD